MDNGKALVPLSQYRKEGYNIVLGLGAETRLSPLYETRLIRLHFSFDVLKGEVHWMGKKKVGDREAHTYMLSRPSLDTIGSLMGIDWDIPVRLDDRTRRDYCSIQQSGFVRRADGTRRRIVGTYALDLEIVELDVRDQQAAKMALEEWTLPKNFWYLKSKSKEDQLDFMVGREMIQKRQTLERKCETGARLRALRSLGIKTTYTQKELEHDFVIGAVVYSPDRSDPEIARAAKEAAMSAMSDLYGEQIEPQQVEYEEVDEVEDVEDVEDVEPPDEPATVEEDRADTSKPGPGLPFEPPEKAQSDGGPSITKYGKTEETPSGSVKKGDGSPPDFLKLGKLAGSGFLTEDERKDLVDWLDKEPLAAAVEKMIEDLEKLQAERSNPPQPATSKEAV